MLHLKVAIYLKLVEVKVTKKELKKRLNDFKNLVAINLTNELVRAAPVDTGRLRNSINWKTEGNVIKIFMMDYAIHVEFGTQPHIIRPKNAKALHWKSGGNDIFATVVHHPGTRPQPFIRNTLRTKFGDIIHNSLVGAFT